MDRGEPDCDHGVAKVPPPGGVGALVRQLICVPFLFFVAGSARADAVVEPMPIEHNPSVRLSSVAATPGPGVPADDTRAVEREVRSALYGQSARIQTCLAGIDLRRDPLRGRARGLSGTLVFTRSRRASARVDRATDVPEAARSCIMEAVRSVAISTVPRGNVEVRFRYTLR